MGLKVLKIQKADMPTPQMGGTSQVPHTNFSMHGKRAQPGEIHKWQSGYFRKESDGNWTPVQIGDKGDWSHVDEHELKNKPQDVQQTERGSQPIPEKDVGRSYIRQIREAVSSNNKQLRDKVFGQLLDKFTPAINGVVNKWASGNAHVRDDLYSAATEALLNIAHSDISLDNEDYSDSGITGYIKKAVDHAVVHEFKKGTPLKISRSIMEGMDNYGKVEDAVWKSTNREPSPKEVFANWGRVLPDVPMNSRTFQEILITKNQMRDMQTMSLDEGLGAGHTPERDVQTVGNKPGVGEKIRGVFTEGAGSAEPELGPDSQLRKEQETSAKMDIYKTVGTQLYKYAFAEKKKAMDNANNPRNHKILKTYLDGIKGEIGKGNEALGATGIQQQHIFKKGDLVKNACISAYGQNYTQQDLQNTQKLISTALSSIRGNVMTGLSNLGYNLSYGYKKEAQIKEPAIKAPRVKQKLTREQKQANRIASGLEMAKSADVLTNTDLNPYVVIATAINALSNLGLPLYLYNKEHGINRV